MKTFILILFAGLVLALDARRIVYRYRRSTQNEYKMCVPEDLMEYCEEMVKQNTKSQAKIVCIRARDRIECIDKIKEREADFGTVDPEDMYVASKVPNEDFVVFEEIRTREEPDAEFRYEGVAVIHKDLKLDSIKDLKGLKSCHTGVGRNVGYKIPLTKLKNMGIIGQLNDPEISPRENELKALSTLFSKACVVGKWSADPIIDAGLKKKYPNLCQLCEHPEKCDYPDIYSGYEGAVRCLAHNNGDIAWTKVIYVRKFFGLPVGITPGKSTEENPNDFAYLCPDGTRVPISETPCRWAARPWQGFLTNADVVKSVDELRKKIEQLNSEGYKNHAKWLPKVFDVSDKNIVRSNKIISPGDYLDKGNYTDVLEREYGPPIKTIRFCVVSDDELAKCRAFGKSAFSRNVRPRFDCVRESTVDDCTKTIRDNGADVIVLDGGHVHRATAAYNLKPIAMEKYGAHNDSYFAVAVVKKNSPYKSFEDLRGVKSCHTGIDRTAGYNVPLYVLLKLGLIAENDCPYAKALSKFFDGGSCLPGAKGADHKLDATVTEKLCKLCAGDLTKREKSSECNADQTESYSGYTGAFRCLAEGGGDVAFVKHVTVPGNTDGKNTEAWASKLKSEDYELLCPNGGRAPVDQYEKCHLLKAPPHMVVTSNSKTDSEINEIQSALISASELYAERPDWFKLFGTFNGKKDLLFKDSATGLAAIHEKLPVMEEYSKVMDTINRCK